MEKITVPTTSLFVCSSRLFVTNEYVGKVLNNPNSTDDEMKSIQEFRRRYNSSLPNLLDHYSKILVYDPYSYYFCNTDESTLIVSNVMDKFHSMYPCFFETELFKKEVLEVIKFPTDLAYKELKNYVLNSPSPMMSWTMLNSQGLLIHMLLRTKYIDDFVQEKINEGFEQFVILGAGLDSRGYRLPFKSGTTVWEVDFPEVLNYKQFVIGNAEIPKVSQANNVFITSDLLQSKEWTSRMDSTGFNRAKKTIWILEGLVFYIDREGTSLILKTVNSMSASGSGILYETISKRYSYHEKLNPMITLFRVDMITTTETPTDLLEDLCFTKDVKSLSEIDTQILYNVKKEDDNEPHVPTSFTIAYKQ
ncbi:hypothetical protein PPL_09594 [Heterostelium album PN500]|uniref:S-adenosyl-L-methionine-dependent methyltransferase n=1 Tax=Heterostelium pallidum (strain ATCC 26659 / Pp 5 / PN500) TaxID=670386 RepID=D3BNS3_HETP5|nr:hypothetical protein PPL_09594 [Heterostelium album PN500]EFA76842.1 hypothetical protein PPL_09594 [Heterostelium album PN500]|eukprot:XP_020428974.1 hypothetical protein PPL_09594 [Heterostelium album PN500]